MATLTRNSDTNEEVIKIDDVFDTFYTKTENDDRYVNVTGDTMTGALYVPTPALP
jgi:hypothetical protein